MHALQARVEGARDEQLAFAARQWGPIRFLVRFFLKIWHTLNDRFKIIVLVAAFVIKLADWWFSRLGTFNHLAGCKDASDLTASLAGGMTISYSTVQTSLWFDQLANFETVACAAERYRQRRQRTCRHRRRLAGCRYQIEDLPSPEKTAHVLSA